MPGFKLLLQTYTKEFGSKPAEQRPTLMALVITDGEAEDTEEFKNAVAQARNNMYVVLAIVGYGSEHDKALQAYQQVAAQNTHVMVLSFDGETDPSVLADALLRMIA